MNECCSLMASLECVFVYITIELRVFVYMTMITRLFLDDHNNTSFSTWSQLGVFV